MLAKEKRKYTRLNPSKWAEVDALWELGDVTLPELSDRFDVSTRALQAHFEKNGVVKGSKARELAIEIRAEIFTRSQGDRDDIVRLAGETHHRTFVSASTVEDMIVRQLQHLAANPAETYRTAAIMKTLSLAAQALERLHSLKSTALGLDKNDRLDEKLPEIIFRDLRHEDIEKLRKQHREEYGIDELDNELSMDDDIVVEEPEDVVDEAA